MDEMTGNHAIQEAYLRDDLYSGPQLGQAPDIVLGFGPGYRMSWQTAVGGVCARVTEENAKHWCGDHIVAPPCVPGSVLSNLPGSFRPAQALSVAGTVLRTLGLKPTV